MYSDSGVITKTRGLNRGETKIVKRRDFLYRQFTQGNKSSLQLIVPSSFGEKVLKLGHESLMAGHLGIKKNLNTKIKTQCLLTVMGKRLNITHYLTI